MKRLFVSLGNRHADRFAVLIFKPFQGESHQCPTEALSPVYFHQKQGVYFAGAVMNG